MPFAFLNIELCQPYSGKNVREPCFVEPTTLERCSYVIVEEYQRILAENKALRKERNKLRQRSIVHAMKIEELQTERDEAQAQLERVHTILLPFPGSTAERAAEVRMGERDDLENKYQALRTENESLRISLPHYSGRDENRADKALGKVMRHHEPDQDPIWSIGVVEANQAKAALVSAYAEVNTLQDELKRDDLGTPHSRLRALHTYAEEHCGHSRFSSRPPEGVIFERIQTLETILQEVRRISPQCDCKECAYCLLDVRIKAVLTANTPDPPRGFFPGGDPDLPTKSEIRAIKLAKDYLDQSEEKD